MKNTILIIDDSTLIRDHLTTNLSSEYIILQAENGEQAIEIITNNFDAIKIILLDLVMPKMNGIEFLHILSKLVGQKDIPIFVITSQKREDYEYTALKMGAYDFLQKPINIDLLKIKIENAIKHTDNKDEIIKFESDFDKLTQIYNKHKFFKTVGEMLKIYNQKHFVFILLDIDKFKLINTYFGEKTGDAILCRIAENLQKQFSPMTNSVYGRIAGDIFAVCCEYNPKDTENIIQQCKNSKHLFENLYQNVIINPSIGIYFIDDNTLPITRIFDRAKLAAEKCKNSYTQICKVFDMSIEKEVMLVQEVTNEMQSSLDSGQFKVFYQPKFDLRTEKIIGAEALVRWVHPKKSIIPPDNFIPLFEANGFITELDSYIFEQVCSHLREWIDSGKKVIPISVNLSRIDLYSTDFLYNIKKCMEKYCLPHKFLHLEITESAFAEDTNQIITVLNHLRNYGFYIEMDDFGKGYSSLNMINDLPFDTIKLDMRFLSGNKSSSRSYNILEFVVNLTEKLNIPAIAEGVETKEDLQILKKIHCPYGQGYYFSKPVNKETFEKLL